MKRKLKLLNDIIIPGNFYFDNPNVEDIFNKSKEILTEIEKNVRDFNVKPLSERKKYQTFVEEDWIYDPKTFIYGSETESSINLALMPERYLKYLLDYQENYPIEKKITQKQITDWYQGYKLDIYQDKLVIVFVNILKTYSNSGSIEYNSSTVERAYRFFADFNSSFRACFNLSADLNSAQ